MVVQPLCCFYFIGMAHHVIAGVICNGSNARRGCPQIFRQDILQRIFFGQAHFIRKRRFRELSARLKNFRLLCPCFVPHVLPPALAGVVFYPAAAALVAAVNILRHMRVIVSPGQCAAPLAAVAFGGADDPGLQPGLALKRNVLFKGVVHHHAGEGAHRFIQYPRRILEAFCFGQLIQQAIHSVGVERGMLRGDADARLLVQSQLHGSGSVRDQGVVFFQQRAHDPVSNVPVELSVRQNVGGQIAAEGFGQRSTHTLGIVSSGSIGIGSRRFVAQQGEKVSPDTFQQRRGDVFFVHRHLSSRCGCRSGRADSPCRSSPGWRC